ARDDYIRDANRYQYVFTCTQYDAAFQCDDSIPDNSDKFSFPVQVDSTNMQIASIEYFERQDGNKMTLNLEDERGRGSVSLRLQNSIFNRLEDTSYFNVETSLANDGKTIVELPHSVKIESTANYETITLQLPNDYTKEDKLQLIITGSEVTVTKTVPEFGIPAVILIIMISATTIYTIVTKRNLITN
ncbi:MAG: hypothetical protein ACRD5H_12940, partial [Nitrososphaerales archaeon]